MDRVQQNTTASLSRTFYEDGVATNPGVVTLTITASDGTPIVTDAATTGTGTGARSYALSAVQTALLDSWTLTWVSTLKGTLSGVCEIVGGYLFSLAEARATPPLNSTTQYPTAVIVDMRTTVEDAIERACGVAFVPRYTLETVSGTGTRDLFLRPSPRTIRSVTVDGSAFSAGDLAAVSMSVTGALYSAARAWTAGTNNVVVGYEHGYGEVPPEIKRAALMLAKMWLVGQRSPIDDRATTFSSAEGGTYSLVVPGRNGSTFGHPDVDAAVDRYSLAVGVA